MEEKEKRVEAEPLWKIERRFEGKRRSIICEPVAFDERVPPPKVISGIGKIFFLSCGRAGTRWMAWALRATSFKTLAVHEPPPRVNQLAYDYCHGKVSDEEVVKGLYRRRALNMKVAQWNFRCARYAETNHSLFPFADHLRLAFPGSIILGLVRNGKDFVRSGADKGIYQWRPDEHWLTPKEGTKDFKDWGHWTELQKLAWLWTTKCSAFADKVDCLFRCEDFWDEDTGLEWWNKLEAMMKIRERTGAEFYNFIRRNIANRTPPGRRAFPVYDDWSKQDKEFFQQRAGPLMKKMGYLEE